jgi:hypothetical protein
LTRAPWREAVPFAGVQITGARIPRRHQSSSTGAARSATPCGCGDPALVITCRRSRAAASRRLASRDGVSLPADVRADGAIRVLSATEAVNEIRQLRAPFGRPAGLPDWPSLNFECCGGRLYPTREAPSSDICGDFPIRPLNAELSNDLHRAWVPILGTASTSHPGHAQFGRRPPFQCIITTASFVARRDRL